jgi:hypothetical protein
MGHDLNNGGQVIAARTSGAQQILSKEQKAPRSGAFVVGNHPAESLSG